VGVRVLGGSGWNGAVLERVAVVAVGLAVAMASQARAERWIEFAANKDRTNVIFVDVDSIKHDGSLVRYSGKIVFNPPAWIPQTGQVAESFIGATVDCAAKTVAVTQEFLKDPQGKVIKSEKSDVLEFHKPRAGSAGERVIDQLCSPAQPGGGFGASPGSGQKPGATPAGSGLAINTQGSVLTANHVVQGCSAVRVLDAAGLVWQASVIAGDPGADLALLKCDRGFAAAAAFRMGAGVRAGDGVFSVGFGLSGSAAREPGVAAGTVTALAGLRNSSWQLRISAPAQPGSAGGPVLDASGSVVGIVIPRADAIRLAGVTGDTPQDVSFAIKGELAQMFLRAQGAEFQTSPSGASLPTEEIVARARAFTVQVECTPAPPTEK
jgi:S1-C subfamily serine protease